MANHFYKSSLSLVIPVYNEEKIIEECVRTSYKHLSVFFQDFELIIVNDGSSDNTSVILSELEKEFGKLTILNNNFNRGIAFSLLRGLKYCSKDYIMHNGADSPFKMEDIGKVFPLIRDHDILVITRNKYSGYSHYRRIISFINLNLLRILFPLKLNDFNYIQIYKKDVIASVNPTATGAGFVVPEILLTAHKLNFSIIEAKHNYYPRTAGIASAGKFIEIKNSFIDMITFWLKY